MARPRGGGPLYSCPLPLLAHKPPAPQGTLLMLVLRLMRGGSLQRALQDPEHHEALAWHNRCGMTDKHCPFVRQQLFSNRRA